MLRSSCRRRLAHRVGSRSGSVGMGILALVMLTGCPIGPGGERGEPLLYSVSPKSGHPGDTISIVGLNLDRMDWVTMGSAMVTGFTKPSPPVDIAYLEEVELVIPPTASGSTLAVWRSGLVRSSLKFQVLTSEIKENEDNETYPYAPHIGSGQYGSGSITGTDQDYFQLSPNSYAWATTFEIEVENKGNIDLSVNFRVKEDSGIGEFMVGAGETHRTWFTLKRQFINFQGQLRNAELGLRIKAAGTAAGSSDYEVRVAAFPVGDDHEPNDVAADAKLLDPTGPKMINGFEYWDYGGINTFLTSAYDAGVNMSIGLTDEFTFPVFANNEPAQYTCFVFTPFLWLDGSPIELSVTDGAGNPVALNNPVGSGPYGDFTVPANTPTQTYRLTLTTAATQEAIYGSGEVGVPPSTGDAPPRARKPLVINVSRDPVNP